MRTNLSATSAALTLAALNLSAQTEAGLNIQTYAGLTIVGEIGKVYSIEYVAGLTEPAESEWRCLEFLQLPASPYLWADQSAPATGQRFYRAVAMQAPENMVFIPPGRFRMGSPEDEQGRWDNEGPQTAVTIGRGYWMGRHEVTQREYVAVMGTNPSLFNGIQGWPEPDSDYGVDLNRPVERLSWDEAVAYCVALTKRDRAAGRIRANSVYRLPTESEWEYACRGWTSTRFSYGDDPGYTNLADHAWYCGDSNGQTHPVGEKLPNPWGLYDMHGNLWEWCQDGWADRLPGGIVLDPQGPATGSHRVIRGGSWNVWDNPRCCRAAFRYNFDRNGRSMFLGFRAVLAPGQP